MSSRRYKHEIMDVVGAERIYDVRIVNFKYTQDRDPEQWVNVGVIAEELNEVFPEFVVKNAAGECETAQYFLFINPVIKCLQEQKIAADDLQEKVQLLGKATAKHEEEIQGHDAALRQLQNEFESWLLVDKDEVKSSPAALDNSREITQLSAATGDCFEDVDKLIFSLTNVADRLRHELDVSRAETAALMLRVELLEVHRTATLLGQRSMEKETSTEVSMGCSGTITPVSMSASAVVRGKRTKKKKTTFASRMARRPVSKSKK